MNLFAETEPTNELLDESSTLNKPKRFNSDWLCLGIILGILLFVLSFGIHAIWVSGQSMHPTLFHRDICIVYSRLLFGDMPIGHNDIVTIKQGNVLLVKRVIACPGDKVQIANGVVLINGHLYDNPSILFDYTPGILEQTCGPNEYFVLGDNRPLSRDSRAFGPITRDNIMSKVVFRFRNPLVK